MKTLRTAALLIAAAMLVCPALAQEQSTLIQRAAAQVPRIHAQMSDPDSFVFENAALTKPIKYGKRRGDVSVCYEFRSHNAMGGYGARGHAILKANNELFLFDTEGLESPGFDCRPKYLDRDITAEVKAALTAAVTPVPVAAADKAKQAQQYADCLKLAVDNPNIACKP